MTKHHSESTISFEFWNIWLHAEFGPLDVFSKSTLDEMDNTVWWRWKRLTAPTFARSPPSHAFWLISPIFLTFLWNGFLGNLGYTLFDDLVKRLWCVSCPPLSPGACRATIKSEVKLEKILTSVLIATKTSWLFPQLKTDKKNLTN